MRNKLGYFLLIFVLAGCVTYGRDFPDYGLTRIKPNVTTQREIFDTYGEPYRKGLESGLETWTYSYQYWELGQVRKSKELSVVFNQDGTVNSYSYTSR